MEKCSLLLTAPPLVVLLVTALNPGDADPQRLPSNLTTSPTLKTAEAAAGAHPTAGGRAEGKKEEHLGLEEKKDL